MPYFATVRVAAVQATPVILDARASMDKAVRRLGEAARDGSSSRCCPSASSRSSRRRLGRAVHPGKRLPRRLPGPSSRGQAIFGEGGSVIVEPTWGGVLAGPLRGEDGVVVADCDLRVGLHAKRWFDAVGHYSRADVLVTPEDETAPA
jgi:hypothetical protein